MHRTCACRRIVLAFHSCVCRKPPALAAKRQTTTIPIIMPPVAVLLARGFSHTLSLPGHGAGFFALGQKTRPKRNGVFKGAGVRNQIIRGARQCKNPFASFLRGCPPVVWP